MKGISGKYMIVILLASLYHASCNTPMPPSDEQMIRHLTQHATAFEEIRSIIDRCPYGRDYPPYDKQDTACLRGIPIEDRERLDSLLAEIGSERIFYLGKEWKRQMRKTSGWNGWDTTYTSFTISYYSHGYSVGGTTKDFVYDPGLKDNRTVQITDEGDLNEIYRQNFNDTTLYKPIQGDWYIKLTHDN